MTDFEIALPPEIEEIVATVGLPAFYRNAVAAIEACDKVDEVAEWSNKAYALAAYARMARDNTLANAAQRIQLRAQRRYGEMLLEYDGRGGKIENEGGPISFDPQTRREAAERAGISASQQVTAVRLARISSEVFEERVESSPPPGATTLSQDGRTHRVTETVSIVSPPRSRDPKTVVTSEDLREAMMRNICDAYTSSLTRLARDTKHYGEEKVLGWLIDKMLPHPEYYADDLKLVTVLLVRLEKALDNKSPEPPARAPLRLVH